MRSQLFRAVRRALFGSALCAAPVVWSQDAPPEDPEELERVTVTAQKREQSILEVPVSVTAIGEQEIDRAGIREFEDYARRVPNLGYTQQGNRAFTKVAIRGVTNIGGKANAVGIYVDEFNIAPNILVNGYSRTLDASLYDIEQIEVLRGPQGTYFGRNTMGGAISLTTRKPVPGVTEGELRLEVDDLDGWLARFAGNVGLGDSAGVGLSLYGAELGGWIENEGPSGADNDGEDRGGRLAWRWQPNEDLTLDVAWSTSRQEQDFPAFVPTGILGTIPTQLVQVVSAFPLLFQPLPVPAIDTSGFPDWPLPTDAVPFYDRNDGRHATDSPFASESDTDIATARLAWTFADHLTLTSVTGWIDNRFEMFGDGDLSPYPAFTVARESDSDAFSQELRLSSFGNERFDWTLGAIYAEDEITETDISRHLASDPYLDGWGALLFALGVQQGAIDPTDPQILELLTNGLVPTVFGPLTVGNFEDVDRGNDTESWALFGDLTWHLSDRWDLSAGLRWTDDRVRFVETTRPTVTLPVGTDRERGSFDDLSPRMALSFFPSEDVTLYASVAKGYKVGGFNSDVTAGLDGVDKRFDEETGWNYELGFKSYLADSRVQFNGAVFRFDWEDLQVRGQDPFSQRQFVQNAADAENTGLELELLARVGENVDLRLAYGHLDAEFGSFRNAVDTDGNVFDATGNRIPYSPENTAAIGLDWGIPINERWSAYVRGDWTYVDDQEFDAENSPGRRIPSYDVLDLRLGFVGGDWEFALFVKNALDEEYALGTQLLETFYSGEQRAVGAPRTVGALVRWRF